MPSLENINLTVSALSSMLLVLLWLGVLRAARYSGWRVALLSLVGTVGHEALHLAAGWVCRAQPTSFSILPKRDGDRWVLGSVGFTNLNIWNSAPVAFAPILLAGVGWLVFQFWTQPAFIDGEYLSWLISGYVVATCLFSCIPSSTDIKIGALSGLMYGGIGYILWSAAQ